MSPKNKQPLIDPIPFVRTHLNGRSLVLVGMMGAGKSTIGRCVAQHLTMPFIDSDYEIEYISQMPIADIFQNYGETEFRRLEEKVVVRLLNDSPSVLATGGGAFLNEKIRQVTKEKAISIWLKADLNILIERVSKRQNRPLLKTKNPPQIMSDLLLQRTPFYQQTDLSITSYRQSPHYIAAQLIKKVAYYLQNEQI